MDVKDLAKMGGKARWQNKTAEQKREHAKAMAAAKKAKKLSTVPAVQQPQQG